MLRMGGLFAVKLVGECCNETIKYCPLRPRLAGRRHHARAYLADCQLPGLGIGSECIVRQQIERNATSLIIKVVTFTAVVFQQGPIYIGISIGGL